MNRKGGATAHVRYLADLDAARPPGQCSSQPLRVGTPNLSALPDHVIDLIDAGLKGQQLVPASDAVTITRSLPHGHVAAVYAMAAKLGLPALLGPAGRPRDLALALIISRVVKPGSKLSTLTWWADTTLGADLGVADASTDDIYAAMDWLEDRQDAIEAGLARRHLAPDANPSRMALFDLSSSWLEGSHCPLAARGYSRDGKKGKLQIEYGLLTDPAGRPVAVRVLPGNTGDPAAFTGIVQVVRDKSGLAKMVMVGDRGMITSARIRALNQLEDRTQRPDPYGWITALRAPAISKLMADGGPLQLRPANKYTGIQRSLFGMSATTSRAWCRQASCVSSRSRRSSRMGSRQGRAAPVTACFVRLFRASFPGGADQISKAPGGGPGMRVAPRGSAEGTGAGSGAAIAWAREVPWWRKQPASPLGCTRLRGHSGATRPRPAAGSAVRRPGMAPSPASAPGPARPLHHPQRRSYRVTAT